MNLREELEEFYSENIAVDEPASVDELWEFLTDKIGPVQEKLMQDTQHAREERDAAMRKVAVLESELAALYTNEDS